MPVDHFRQNGVSEKVIVRLLTHEIGIIGGQLIEQCFDILLRCRSQDVIDIAAEIPISLREERGGHTAGNELTLARQVNTKFCFDEAGKAVEIMVREVKHVFFLRELRLH